VWSVSWSGQGIPTHAQLIGNGLASYAFKGISKGKSEESVCYLQLGFPKICFLKDTVQLAIGVMDKTACCCVIAVTIPIIWNVWILP
jgi:hypothetical protein